jgi:two-component system cell cycle sensor histidine kinase PleC
MALAAGTVKHQIAGPKPRKSRRTRPDTSYRNVRSELKHSMREKTEFDYELLAMFVRNELAAQWTILLLALIFSLASMFWAPYEQAIGWLIIVIGAKVLLLDVCRRFMAAERDEVPTSVWQRRLFIAEAVGGMAWAGFALVGVGGTGNATPETLFSSHVFLFASLIVIIAIRMTFAATVPANLYVGTIPMTIAVVARLVMLGDFFYMALAAMAVGVHVYFIFLAKGLQSTAQSMLEFREQKDMLITDLEEARVMSDQARRRAEDANLAKSQFLATMSHELRTPLNAILGFSEVMMKEIMGPLENKTYKEYTGNIHTSGAHLLNLINEILDLSRIEAGKYELHEQSMNICDTLDDCHRLMRLRAENKGLKLIEDFGPGMATIWADERAIRQICLNLLTNAIKFTPRGGSVTMSAATEADGSQIICISDNGPGIPKEEIPKVMSSFGQGSLAQKSAEGGTGLGLPIVQSLIELHGGTFELQSEVRKGTRAIIRIPVTRVLNTMEAVPPAAGKPPPGHTGSTPRQTKRPAGLKPATMHEAPAPRRKSRLITPDKASKPGARSDRRPGFREDNRSSTVPHTATGKASSKGFGKGSGSPMRTRA